MVAAAASSRTSQLLYTPCRSKSHRTCASFLWAALQKEEVQGVCDPCPLTLAEVHKTAHWGLSHGPMA